MSFIEILYYTSSWSALLGILLGFVKRPRQENGTLYAWLYCVLVFSNERIGVQLAKVFHSNALANHIYTPISVIFLALLFLSLGMHHKRQVGVTVIVMVAMLLFSTLNMLVWQPIAGNEQNTYGPMFAGVLQTFLIFIFWIDLLKQEHLKPLAENSAFWMSVALLLYSVTPILGFYAQDLIAREEGTPGTYYQLNWILTILNNLGMAYFIFKQIPND